MAGSNLTILLSIGMRNVFEAVVVQNLPKTVGPQSVMAEELVFINSAMDNSCNGLVTYWACRPPKNKKSSNHFFLDSRYIQDHLKLKISRRESSSHPL